MSIKMFRLPLLLLALSLLCMAGYHLLGARVDGDGVLLEPFALVPLGWLLLLLSLAVLVVQWFRHKRASAIG